MSEDQLTVLSLIAVLFAEVLLLVILGWVFFKLIDWETRLYEAKDGGLEKLSALRLQVRTLRRMAENAQVSDFTKFSPLFRIWFRFQRLTELIRIFKSASSGRSRSSAPS